MNLALPLRNNVLCSPKERREGSLPVIPPGGALGGSLCQLPGYLMPPFSPQSRTASLLVVRTWSQTWGGNMELKMERMSGPEIQRKPIGKYIN